MIVERTTSPVNRAAVNRLLAIYKSSWPVWIGRHGRSRSRAFVLAIDTESPHRLPACDAGVTIVAVSTIGRTRPSRMEHVEPPL